jgi:hypothetical protein
MSTTRSRKCATEGQARAQVAAIGDRISGWAAADSRQTKAVVCSTGDRRLGFGLSAATSSAGSYADVKPAWPLSDPSTAITFDGQKWQAAVVAAPSLSRSGHQ